MDTMKLIPGRKVFEEFYPRKQRLNFQKFLSPLNNTNLDLLQFFSYVPPTDANWYLGNSEPRGRSRYRPRRTTAIAALGSQRRFSGRTRGGSRVDVCKMTHLGSDVDIFGILLGITDVNSSQWLTILFVN